MTISLRNKTRSVYRDLVLSFPSSLVLPRWTFEKMGNWSCVIFLSKVSELLLTLFPTKSIMASLPVSFAIKKALATSTSSTIPLAMSINRLISSFSGSNWNWLPNLPLITERYLNVIFALFNSQQNHIVMDNFFIIIKPTHPLQISYNCCPLVNCKVPLCCSNILSAAAYCTSLSWFRFLNNSLLLSKITRYSVKRYIFWTFDYMLALLKLCVHLWCGFW